MFTVVPKTSFSQREDAAQNLAANRNIKVIELRNYLVRRGQRDEFINLFEENFVESQNALGGFAVSRICPRD